MADCNALYDNDDDDDRRETGRHQRSKTATETEGKNHDKHYTGRRILTKCLWTDSLKSVHAIFNILTRVHAESLLSL